MPYKDVYDHCQELDLAISRNAIKAKMLELVPTPGVMFWAAELDTNYSLGYYLSARNVERRFVQQAGGKAVIVVARSLDEDWKRFVTVKEMMHMFDDPLESTTTPADLEALLADFCGSSENGEFTIQMRSEMRCFWMAIGLLCPEDKRIDLLAKRETGQVTDAEIARTLKVPEKYVPSFFNHRYKDIIANLRKKN